MQGPQGFERTQNTQHAIELAARGLGVQMRAHGDGKCLGVLAGAGGEHIADRVDFHLAAQGFALRLEPITHLFVFIRDGEPLDAAFGRAAEFGGVHQHIPQALRVDGQVLAAHGVTSTRETGRGEVSSFQVLLATWMAGKAGRSIYLPWPFCASICLSFHTTAPRFSTMTGRPVH